jgi:hypothetical protein
MEARKWLRQQSKDFNAADFDTLVKRWDKCINVGGGYCDIRAASITIEEGNDSVNILATTNTDNNSEYIIITRY